MNRWSQITLKEVYERMKNPSKVITEAFTAKARVQLDVADLLAPDLSARIRKNAGSHFKSKTVWDISDMTLIDSTTNGKILWFDVEFVKRNS